MRKKLTLFTIICMSLFSLLTTTVFATTFTLGGTDLTIDVDDSIWYVFTRDNLENNPELDELGLTSEDVTNILHTYNAYMDAVLFYEDGEYLECFVVKETNDGEAVNLSNYSTSEIKKWAKEVAEEANVETYSTYENNYKFIKLESYDSDLGYYLCEYITIVNHDIYNIKFQATSPFSDWEYQEMQKIIDSIHFNIDESLKEPSTTSPILSAAIKGGLIGGIGSIIGLFINKKKKKRNIETY